MRIQFNSLAGVLALAISTTLAAQTQPAVQQSAPAVTPQSPAQTKTTTTQSTSTTAVVPDQTGGAATQRTTDTTSTTSTQPANAAPGATVPSSTSRTTTTTTARPDEPGAATTTTTTTTQPATDRTGAAVTTATAADVKAGVPVFDQKGGVVGKIESVSAKGAVVSTGKARAVIPVSSFGKNDKGLVMSMTKAELEAASAKSAPKTQPKKKSPK
jgi:hypothetical protein